MEAKSTELDNSTNEYLRFRNQEDQGININNSQGFSLDFPILIKDSENSALSRELNLIDSFNVGSSLSTDKTDEKSESEEANEERRLRVFSCNYCQRKFFSWQALGGHQNAHKQERIIERRDRLHRLSSFRHANMSNHRDLYNRHHRLISSLSSLPLHGSLNNNRSTSVFQSRSTFSKPTSSVLPPPFRSNSSHHNLQYHHLEGLSSSRLPNIMNNQPPIGRRLLSFVHGSTQPLHRLNDGFIGGSFLFQGSGDGVGSKSSNFNQGDSKKIDLALKL